MQLESHIDDSADAQNGKCFEAILLYSFGRFAEAEKAKKFFFIFSTLVLQIITALDMHL